MADEPENNVEWTDCPAGRLRAMVDDIAVSDRRRHASGTFAGMASILVLAIVVGAIVFWGRTPSGNPDVGDMTCAECQKYFEAYHSHLVQGTTSLAADVIHGMERHLEHCLGCRKHFDELYPGLLAQLRAISPQAGAFASSAPSPVLLASHLLTGVAL